MKKILIISSIFSAAFAMQAATLTFTNAGGDYSWDTASNWGGTLPKTSDSVLIDTTGATTGVTWENNNNLILTSDVTVDTFTFKASSDNWSSTSYNNSISGGKTVNANNAFISAKNRGSSLDVSLNIANTLTVNGSSDVSVNRIRTNNLTITTGILTHKTTSTKTDMGIIATGKVSVANNQYFKIIGDKGEFYNQFGGLIGAGRICSHNSTSAANGYLYLTGADSYTFSGEISYNYDYWPQSGVQRIGNKTLNVFKTGTGSQYFTNKTRTAFSTVTVENGTFAMTGDISGKLSLNGGLFGVTNGKATAGTAEWTSGGFIFDKAALTNKYTINITGDFDKAADGQIIIDFAGLDVLAESLIGTTSDLIVAGYVDDTIFDKTNANTDFIASNIKNGTVNFSWSDNTLKATFASVPESSTIACIFGVLSLAFVVAYRRR